MNFLVRNIVLFILFCIIQYQLWLSPSGVAMSQYLQEEIQVLKFQHQNVVNVVKTITPTLLIEARDELLEEQAREVYHYVGKSEVFFTYEAFDSQ